MHSRQPPFHPPERTLQPHTTRPGMQLFYAFEFLLGYLFRIGNVFGLSPSFKQKRAQPGRFVGAQGFCILKVGVRTPLVTTSLFPKPPTPPQCGVGLLAKKLFRVSEREDREVAGASSLP